MIFGTNATYAVSDNIMYDISHFDILRSSSNQKIVYSQHLIQTLSSQQNQFSRNVARHGRCFSYWHLNVVLFIHMSVYVCSHFVFPHCSAVVHVAGIRVCFLFFFFSYFLTGGGIKKTPKADVIIRLRSEVVFRQIRMINVP